MDDTPLGRTVMIRREADKDIIKNFGTHEKKIRSQWTLFRDSKVQEECTEEDKRKTAAYFEKLFANMLGGGGK